MDIKSFLQRASSATTAAPTPPKRKPKVNPEDFKFPLTVYREVSVPSFEEIRLESLGTFWTTSVGYAESYNDDLVNDSPSSHRKKFLLVTSVGKDQVNWTATKKARLHPRYGEEDEITLIGGTPLKVHLDGKPKVFKAKA